MSTATRSCVLASAWLALIAISPPTFAQQPTASVVPPKPTPGFKTADIGDKELRYKCEGEESPAVIIEQGPLPKEWTDAVEPVWSELQQELAGLSTNSKHLTASKAGHNIQLEEPDLVLDSILDVVSQVRRR